MAPSKMCLPAEQLDKEFFQLANTEGITDIDELNRVLDRSVGIRTFLTADDHINEVAQFVATHFQETVHPLGYKAFLVAVNREACAKYKQALDRHLPPEWSEAIYTANAADVTERPLIAQLQLSRSQEDDARKLFKKPTESPKILIVTDKLLTGYDAPVLYCLYLDKPMRNHVLLQTLARVNRPYVDANGVSKRIGLVVDFVSVLKDLKKALQFDSSDVIGVIEDLDLFLEDFKIKIASAEQIYLNDAGADAPDEQLERIVYGQFLTPESRKIFFDDYKDIENLWEILSPSPELREHIKSFKQLASLYSIVRNAYAQKFGFIADLAYKTRRLVEANVTKEGLGRLTKSITFDLNTLDALRAKDGSDEGKVFNLVRGLQKEIDENPDLASVLLPLKDRADRILRDLETRQTSGLVAMDLLAALAQEKEDADNAAKASGLSPNGFAVFWALENEPVVVASGLVAKAIAEEVEGLTARFPNASVNSDENRQLRANLYRPLLPLPKDERARIVELIMGTILGQ
jgi:type I restriction enzyme R subunit